MPEKEPRAKIGIVTVSDRASRGEYEDRGGPAIEKYLTEVLTSPWEKVTRVVPDEISVLKLTLEELCEDQNCCMIITTGGTGPSKRDITPEVTEKFCDKLLPGFGEMMRKISFEIVPTALLSRQTAGVKGNTFLINLPGQPKAIAECLDAVFAAIPYCIDLIDGPYLTTDEKRIKSFRPKKK